MRIDIDEAIVKKIGNIAEKYKYEVYAVGGYVRDKLLEIDAKDIDFVVVGDGVKFAKIVAKELGRKRLILFPRFRTARLVLGNYELEFVGAREEVYDENSRNPNVKEATLQSDLERRDFTVNALAVHINGDNFGEVIDRLGGISDMSDKIIRTPKDPKVTYFDDPLRMVRAIRFATKLKFNIEKSSFNAIRECRKRLKIVSVERVQDEFFKILSYEKPSIGMKLMDDCGLLELLFPELYSLKGVEVVDGVDHKDIFVHTLKVLDNVAANTKSIIVRLAALFHDVGKPRVKKFSKEHGFTFYGHEDVGAKIFDKIAKRLKMSNEIREKVSLLIKLHHRPISLTTDEVSDSGVRRFLFDGGELCDDLMVLCRADITTANKNKLKRFLENYDKLSKMIVEVEERDRIRNFKPPVSGEEIMEFFDIQAGPLVGKIKSYITDKILDGELRNDKNDCLKVLEKIKTGELEIDN